MRVTSLTVGPFRENCWILHEPELGEVVLVDPGDEADRIVAAVAATGARLTDIVLTHAHLDHVGALAGVRRAWPGVPVHMHPAEAPVFDFAPRAAALYGLPFERSEPPEREILEGQVLSLAGAAFEVWHLPGHAPGHVAFIGEGMAFGGDVLFAGSVGRTDLPLSDPAALDRSLQRLLTLPAETVVHPGHGPSTTMAEEARSNPFLNGTALVPGR